MKIYARQRHRVLQVVTKMIVPFVLLFALYVQFHGDYGPGGGFQAGVIFAAAFILHGLIFGLQRTRRVVTPGALRVLMSAGVLLYAGTGVLSMLLGGNLLDYDVLAHDPLHGQHWGIFAVELGVGITVTGVMISLFYNFASRRDIDAVAPLRPDADVGVGRRTAEALHRPTRDGAASPAPRASGRRGGGGAMSTVLGLYNYWIVIVLMMAGLYILIARYNLVKKMIGLGVFQTSIFYLYITLGKVEGGTAPILIENPPEPIVYSNPLPHVLILTAIVVGVATTAVALALTVRIFETFGTIEEDEIKAIEAREPDA